MMLRKHLGIFSPSRRILRAKKLIDISAIFPHIVQCNVIRINDSFLRSFIASFSRPNLLFFYELHIQRKPVGTIELISALLNLHINLLMINIITAHITQTNALPFKIVSLTLL